MPPGRGLRRGENCWLRLTTVIAQCLRLLWALFHLLSTSSFCLTRLFFQRLHQVRPGPRQDSQRIFGYCWYEIFLACWMLFLLPKQQKWLRLGDLCCVIVCAVIALGYVFIYVSSAAKTLFAIFSATAWYFSVKFYVFMWLFYLHLTSKWH